MIDVIVATDEEVFAEIYAGLRRFAAVVGPADVHPDDLVQEALARRLAIGPLTDLDEPSRYLRRAIANLASNGRRRIRRAARATAVLASDGDVAAAAYPSDLTDLAALAPRERAALYLHHVEGWPFAEVAEQLGCTEEAARKAASRGRRRLAARLEEDE